MIEIRPISQKAARAWIKEHHRHLSPPGGDVIRAACYVDGVLSGVAMAGHPVARALDDGVTLEITRVAVLLGAPNVCTALYGALRQAARALGWRRIVTYTLEHEGGASLRAAGWRRDGTVRGREWSCPSRPRRPSESPVDKVRWLWEREPTVVVRESRDAPEHAPP